MTIYTQNLGEITDVLCSDFQKMELMPELSPDASLQKRTNGFLSGPVSSSYSNSYCLCQLGSWNLEYSRNE